jgi:hypothetical protein
MMHSTTNNRLNNLIDQFVALFNNDVKQRDSNWYKLMGITIGGSEIASIMGLSPFTSFYKVVESKIEICKGLKQWNDIDTLSCWWGTVFEGIITKYVEFDLGNKIKGANICIQKYEGHRNSPDGYMIVHFYKEDGQYCIWTTDLDKSIIELSIIVLIEFKCPITRKVTGDIPKYYVPQVLSGLSVSPIAYKGLFVDALFKKCSIKDLGNNPTYDYNFHKKNIKSCTGLPIAWGSITIYLSTGVNKTSPKIINLLDLYKNNDGVVDLGLICQDAFSLIMARINDKTLLASKSTVVFPDGRGSPKAINDEDIQGYTIYAHLPWKLFDVTYILIDREPNFLENIMPLINKVHTLVRDNINEENTTADNIKMSHMCNNIYS